MNVVVLSIDRLHAGYLGCYGNTWVATPHFNRLAAESFLFDQATTDHPRLEELLRSWWLGRHVREHAVFEQPPTLAQRLAAAGFATCLITDEPRVANHPLSARFADLVNIEGAAQRPADRPAEDASATRAAALFAAATERLTEAKPPFFLWIHSSGMETAWDAPDEFRQLYAEPDEPEPPRVEAVPSRRLGRDEDPDQVWGICQAYAGQVSLLDACLGGLLESLQSEAHASETLLAVVGMRGFPLGRNGRIGSPDEALYTELVHIPWLMRLPAAAGAAARSQALVQPCDLAPTLAAALEIAGAGAETYARNLLPIIREEVDAVRGCVSLVGREGERAIRTPAWYLRLAEVNDGAQTTELYAKPDDRWDQNDVADRCPEIAEGLAAALGELEASIAAKATDSFPPLSEALVSDLR